MLVLFPEKYFVKDCNDRWKKYWIGMVGFHRRWFLIFWCLTSYFTLMTLTGALEGSWVCLVDAVFATIFSGLTVLQWASIPEARRFSERQFESVEEYAAALTRCGAESF